jgi:diaminohydroxyphosphoribosylaminopyrimidine deaminase/5-amino-6-(5-phosphoribosylamino)uracil reductase
VNPGVLVFTSAAVPLKRVNRLQRAGAEVIQIPQGKLQTRNILKILGKRGVTSLLVEGGGEVLGSFFFEKEVQEVMFFIAPMVLGGRDAIKAVAGNGFYRWQDSVALENLQVRRVGPDLMVTGKVRRRE